MTQTVSMPEELRRLARLFPTDRPLYIVGGYVRQALLGQDPPQSDVDLASACTPQEVQELLQDSEFAVTPASPRLGTLILKGARSYEYTAFRTDSYRGCGGRHTPKQVTFTRSLEQDALRRDFRCNAIYYDINADRIVDPLDGRKDIERSRLTCVDDPARVLSEDGLRLLRLIRFVSVLGFEPDADTLAQAKQQAWRLWDISPERIAGELNGILAGEHVLAALHLMRDCGILEQILPELAQGDGMAQNPVYHCYDVLEHTLHAVAYAPRSIRLAALLHDVGKPACMERDGNYYRHDVVGAQMTRQILTRLKYPNKVIDRTARLVGAHMMAIRSDIRENKLRLFVARNADILDDLAQLMHADARATGKGTHSAFAERMLDTYAQMRREEVPMRVQDMAIGGQDLLAMGASGKQIGMILQELWLQCLQSGSDHSRKRLEEPAHRRVERYKEKRQ